MRQSERNLLLGLGALVAWAWMSQKREIRKSAVLVQSGARAAGKKVALLMDRIGEFLSMMWPSAQQVGQEYQLPPALIITATAHESGGIQPRGLSGLAIKAFNLFGIKPGEAWMKAGKPYVMMPTTEWVAGMPKKVDQPFRRYGSYMESMRDYARLLTTAPRYKAVVVAAREGNLQKAFDELGRSGYATDPKYGAKLTKVYQELKGRLV